MIVAVDANVIVYAMTGAANVHRPAHEWLTAIDATDALIITSALSRLECLVGPKKLARPREENLFSKFFNKIVVIPISDDVLEHGASIRATNRSFRTPDAVHLASAQVAQVDLFLTADRRLKAYRGVTVVDILRESPNSFIR
jgi:predicted nucleic acid-binding protein